MSFSRCLYEDLKTGDRTLCTASSNILALVLLPRLFQSLPHFCGLGFLCRHHLRLFWYSCYFPSTSGAISSVPPLFFHWLWQQRVCSRVGNQFTLPDRVKIQLKYSHVWLTVSAFGSAPLTHFQICVFTSHTLTDCCANWCRLVQTLPNWESWVKSGK